MDASFFADGGVAAAEKLAVLEASGFPLTTIGAIGEVWMPPRTAMARASRSEPSIPYLRPYDVFDYLPSAADHVSIPRNKNIDQFRIREGMILQTRSGRNLGPNTIADSHLAQFALSDDMVRISVEDGNQRLALLAYLRTPMGQVMLRRDRSGSVIDHLTVGDVASLQIPDSRSLGHPIVVEAMRKAVRLRDEGRGLLKGALEELERRLPVEVPLKMSWDLSVSKLGGRLDAALHAPHVTAARTQAASCGNSLGELAEVAIPSRYKRYYVEKEFGDPIVSGRQILQAEPINLRYVAARSFKDPEPYRISAGMIIFGADGRSEGKQGLPSLVTNERTGWLASEHVLRLIPRPGVSPGALWLAVSSAQAQLQIKAFSFGSVIDELRSDDIARVMVPSVDDELGAMAASGWQKLSESNSHLEMATVQMEKMLKI